MNKIEKYLHSKLPLDLGEYAQSCKIQAFHKGKLVVDTGWGKDYKYYDIASLTKIVFGNSAMMNLVHQKKVKLHLPLATYLPWLPYKKIKVENLLTHTSGMQWWKPYFKQISTEIDVELRWHELKSILVQEQLSPVKKAVYSDLDYFFLSFLLQEVENKPLSQIFNDLPLPGFHFNENNITKYKKAFYAPTEKCSWRKKILQGEVHDENAWALGGISTHAGLFASIDALGSYGLTLRQQYKDHPSSLNYFFKKATNKGDWTLGFMQPSAGFSSSGNYFSSSSIGHTGFTGTSLWFDPKKDLLVCILSNRVYPTRNNRKFVELRPLIHDYIYEGVFDV